VTEHRLTQINHSMLDKNILNCMGTQDTETPKATPWELARLCWHNGDVKMTRSRVDDLRDPVLAMLAANTAVLASMVRLGVVDRTKLLAELRSLIAQLEPEERQEPYRFCLDQIVSAIETDNPVALPPMVH
jgi:hypothetical protein